MESSDSFSEEEVGVSVPEMQDSPVIIFEYLSVYVELLSWLYGQ